MPPPNWTADKPVGIFLISDIHRGPRAEYVLRFVQQGYGRRGAICDTRGLQIANLYCYDLKRLENGTFLGPETVSKQQVLKAGTTNRTTNRTM